ncbi:MAG: hypothetical protein M1831_001818 [Alyxoria varia]|nr:MAG: hypothetical protein M1831_001818 [Alyxoria varia]
MFPTPTQASPVTVSIKDLETDAVPLSTLEEAFGPSSLGIILVKDLQERYVDLRRRVLSYSSLLAGLPEEKLAELENAQAKYLAGWSSGKETLKSGHYDTLKGSYYINCDFTASSLPQQPPSENPPDLNFPEYTSPTPWPSEHDLPGFRQSSKSLCTLIIDVAALVARACDRYGEARVEGYESGYLERVVRTSRTNKARLLHYFPMETDAFANGHGNDDVDGDTDGESNERQDEDDWCATHVDHGCLTGLTSAMYVDEAANPPVLSAAASSPYPEPLPELPTSPDPQSGLYIRDRRNRLTQVRMPRECLAFQTGEALELITRGRFKAVPHFVRGVSSGRQGQGQGGGVVEGRTQAKVARNTLAVFTQPNLNEVVDPSRGLDFAGFCREVIARNQ